MGNTLTKNITKIIFVCTPILIVCLALLLDKKNLFDIYLPAESMTKWNDELFYYKQVEAMNFLGHPLGYYGYNESKAQLLMFASWNPFVLLPWYIWSLFFGWTLFSPILFNVLIFSIALLLLLYFVKPSFKQQIMLILIFLLYRPLARWIISCTPEILFIAISTIVIALCLSKKRNYYLAINLLIAFMTIIRPYYLLFYLFPIAKAENSFQKKLTALFAAFAFAMHYILNKLFTAPYLFKIINTEYWDRINENGWREIRFIVSDFIKNIDLLFEVIKGGLGKNYIEGSVYFVFFLLLIFLMVDVYKAVLGRKTDDFIKICVVIMCILICAIIVLYTVFEGYRHILSISIIALLILVLLAENNRIRIGIICFLLFYLFFINYNKYNFSIPYNDSQKEQIELLEKNISSVIKLDYETVSFSNTIIWVYQDIVEETEKRLDWRLLYALPKGIGINLCTYDYLINNEEKIKASYIATLPNGEVELMLKNKGFKSIYHDKNISILKQEN